MSISSMAAAAVARRPDFSPPGVPRGITGIADAVTAIPTTTFARAPAAPTAPAQPGAANRLPTAPAQPSAGRLPVAPAQPTGAPQSSASAASLTSNASAALQVITTYIPTEVLTLYVAVLAALRDPTSHTVSPTSAERAYFFFLVATPLIVWLVYAAKLKSAKPAGALPLGLSAWPIWEMSAASIAYTAWAVALPDSPFTNLGVTPAIGGVVVLLASTLLGLAAPVFQRPLGT